MLISLLCVCGVAVDDGIGWKQRCLRVDEASKFILLNFQYRTYLSIVPSTFSPKKINTHKNHI